MGQLAGDSFRYNLNGQILTPNLTTKAPFNHPYYRHNGRHQHKARLCGSRTALRTHPCIYILPPVTTVNERAPPTLNTSRAAFLCFLLDDDTTIILVPLRYMSSRLLVRTDVEL
jgi:hypothetical protein